MIDGVAVRHGGEVAGTHMPFSSGRFLVGSISRQTCSPPLLKNTDIAPFFPPTTPDLWPPLPSGGVGGGFPHIRTSRDNTPSFCCRHCIILLSLYIILILKILLGNQRERKCKIDRIISVSVHDD